MKTEFLYLLGIVLLLFGTYLYVRRRMPKKTNTIKRDYETLPRFEATQFFKIDSKPESFILELDPFASKTQKNGRKFLIFSPDEEGCHLVIVSDAKRHHSSLLRDPRAQGLTPLYAYIVHPAQKQNRGEKAITLPAGKSISTEIFEESKKNLSWFTRTILPREDFHNFLS